MNSAFNSHLNLILGHGKAKKKRSCVSIGVIMLEKVKSKMETLSSGDCRPQSHGQLQYHYQVRKKDIERSARVAMDQMPLPSQPFKVVSR